MQLQTRVLALALSGDREATAENAPIPVTIATTTVVQRDGYPEILDCSPSGVDLSRVPLALIVAHNTSNLGIGIVEAVRATGDRVTGQVRFGSSPEAQQVRADVLAGIHRYVSVGYALLDDGKESPQGMVFRWRPHEVSIVPAPADINAGFFRSIQGINMHNQQDAALEESGTNLSRSQRRAALRQAESSTQQRAAEMARVEELSTLAERFHARHLLPSSIADGIDEAEFRRRILEDRAERDIQAGGHHNSRPLLQGRESEAALVYNTLVERLGGRAQGEVLRSASCVDLAARCLEASGAAVSTRDSRDRIITRALQERSFGGGHTTSDFPGLLGDAVGRVLAERYDEMPPALRRVARLNNLRDFRNRQVIRMGASPSLEKVGEHGEFRHGTVAEASNSWRLATFGRILSITRQALVNDDLGGFQEVIQRFGEAAARREADELLTLLVSNPTVDGAAVFSTGNSSLVTDVLAIDGLGAAVAKLRAQRDGGELVTQEPGALVVPAALEMKARQLVASFTANQPSDVQPWKLEVVVEPRLDASSATAWYLVSSNQRAFEYGYLDGAAGVQTFMEEGWTVDGLEVKARLDFGCGWTGKVGWVKSTGAGA